MAWIHSPYSAFKVISCTGGFLPNIQMRKRGIMDCLGASEVCPASDLEWSTEKSCKESLEFATCKRRDLACS